MNRERELKSAALASIRIEPNENSGRRPKDPLEMALPDRSRIDIDDWLIVAEIVGVDLFNSRRPSHLNNGGDRIAYMRASLRRWAVAQDASEPQGVSL